MESTSAACRGPRPAIEAPTSSSRSEAGGGAATRAFGFDKRPAALEEATGRSVGLSCPTEAFPKIGLFSRAANEPSRQSCDLMVAAILQRTVRALFRADISSDS